MTTFHAMAWSHAAARGHVDVYGLNCHLMSGSELPPRTMSVSEALLQLGSVLVSIAHVTTEGHVDVHGLCCHLKLCCLCAIGAPLIWVTCTTTWDHVMSKPMLPQKTMSGSMVLLQPGSQLMSMAHANVHGLCYSLNPVDLYGLGCIQGPCLSLWAWGCVHGLWCHPETHGSPWSVLLPTIKIKKATLAVIWCLQIYSWKRGTWKASVIIPTLPAHQK